MSARLSPDGLYYWDGAAWVSMLSPDGAYRWNGTVWVPAAGGPMYVATRAVRREPTSWTRPLQIAVIAIYGVSAISAFLTPYFLSNRMADYMRQTFERQQAANPGRRPLPPGFVDTMAQMAIWMVWGALAVGFAIAVFAIVAAIKRWTWAYYAILILLGLGLLSLPANVANVVSGQVPAPPYPTWVYALALANAAVSAGLLAWMLIAAIRYGPWAMRRVA